MSSSSNSTGSSGITFGGLLFLVFLVLKLTDLIDWSWWWVTAPLWTPAALLAVFFIIATPIAYFSVLRDRGRARR